MLSSVLLV